MLISKSWYVLKSLKQNYKISSAQSHPSEISKLYQDKN